MNKIIRPLQKTAIIAAPCRRIRFPDEETRKIAFRVLFRSGQALEFLDGDDYGVTSEHQLNLLRQQNIPFVLV